MAVELGDYNQLYFPSEIPTVGCVTHNQLTLLYIGIAPQSNLSKETLYTRIRKHIRGNAHGSTLRLSLGCLLCTELGIELRRVSEKRMTFVDGEKRLSDWMTSNAFVAWMPHNAPWEVEAELIQTISPPLNLEHNEQHRFYSILSDKRKSAKDKARRLPIVR